MHSRQRYRLILFLLTAVSALGFGFGLVSPVTALNFVQHGGYFVIAAAFLCFVVALVRLARAEEHPAWVTPANGRLLAATLFFGLLWQLHGPHGFKVLMDEYVLSAAAMNMHFEREVFVPLKTHDLHGVYTTLGGVVDKRPLFFPYLLSLLHDLSGYRSGNVFFLNGLLSAVFLYLAGLFARRLGRHEYAGLLAVALLGGLPLVASNAGGAGFEILNLTMMVGVMLLGQRYLERPDERGLDAFVLGTVLLAQTRYESALFVLSAAVVILAGWIKSRRVNVSWGTVAAPLLLLPIPLQNKVFAINKGYWQLDDGAGAPFQLHFLPGNLGHAIEFLFTVDGFQLGSPVLAAAGLVCFLFFLVFVARRWRRLSAEADTAVLTAFATAVLLNFTLLLCYHWGQLDDYMASRLGLPLLLFFALTSAFVIGRWKPHPKLWPILLGAPVLWALLGALPINARAQAAMTFLTYREVEWQQELVRESRDSRTLFIFPSPLPAVVERKPTMSVEVLAERAEEMAFHFEKETYTEVLIFQRLEIDPATEVVRPAEHSCLGPEFLLETIEERRFKPLYVARLSRLVAIDLTRQEPRPPDWSPSFPPFEINVTEDDPTPTGAYIQEYLRKLP